MAYWDVVMPIGLPDLYALALIAAGVRHQEGSALTPSSSLMPSPIVVVHENGIYIPQMC